MLLAEPVDAVLRRSDADVGELVGEQPVAELRIVGVCLPQRVDGVGVVAVPVRDRVGEPGGHCQTRSGRFGRALETASVELTGPLGAAGKRSGGRYSPVAQYWFRRSIASERESDFT